MEIVIGTDAGHQENTVPRSMPVIFDYAAAALLTVLALVGRWLLDPYLGDSQELSLLFGVVAIAVWRGGPGPATFATITGYLACDYLFMRPRGALGVINVQEVVGLSTYLVSCVAIIVFGEGMRRANRRAGRLADNLKLAEARKDEFLATLAHELRNRLAPIGTAVDVLRHERAVGRMTDIIARQFKHMSRLVDDLFDISRIAAGQIRLCEEHVDLSAVLREAIEASRPHIDAAGQTLRLDLPAVPVVLYADPTRLMQVFSNLLNNASRYTPDAGAIELSVACDPAFARVAIRDNGIGIPAQMLSRIFDSFMRLDRPTERASAGLGIGLTLARRLLALHDATIEVSSEGAGRGSTFVVQLPLSRRAPTVAAARPSQSQARRLQPIT